jgi:hypothetical protein
VGRAGNVSQDEIKSEEEKKNEKPQKQKKKKSSRDWENNRITIE